MEIKQGPSRRKGNINSIALKATAAAVLALSAEGVAASTSGCD